MLEENLKLEISKEVIEMPSICWKNINKKENVCNK